MNLELKVYKTYRAKKPRATTGWNSYVNDRTIVWMGSEELQYDGPSVKNGSHYPKISIEKFLEWAEKDVTEELPTGDYLPWAVFKEKK